MCSDVYRNVSKTNRTHSSPSPKYTIRLSPGLLRSRTAHLSICLRWPCKIHPECYGFKVTLPFTHAGFIFRHRVEECLKTLNPSVRRTSGLIASAALFRTGISDPFGVCNGDCRGRRTPFPPKKISVRIQGGESGVGELFGLGKQETQKLGKSEPWTFAVDVATSFYRFGDRLSLTDAVKRHRRVRKPPSLCVRMNAKSGEVGIRSGFLIDLFSGRHSRGTHSEDSRAAVEQTPPRCVNKQNRIRIGLIAPGHVRYPPKQRFPIASGTPE